MPDSQDAPPILRDQARRDGDAVDFIPAGSTRASLRWDTASAEQVMADIRDVARLTPIQPYQLILPPGEQAIVDQAEKDARKAKARELALLAAAGTLSATLLAGEIAACVYRGQLL
jgi:hypothetical protein